MSDAIKATVRDMLADCDEAIRVLEKQRRSLRAMAVQLGMETTEPETQVTDVPHMGGPAEEIERIRKELMAKVMADRDRIMKQAQEVTAAASQQMSGAGNAFSTAPGTPGMPNMFGMPGAGFANPPWGPPTEKKDK